LKISVATPSLLANLQTVTRVSSTRSAVQALSGVMLDATADRLGLLATDLEVGIDVRMDADVAANGRVVLPGRLLLDVIRSLPDGEVSLELRPQEGDVELRSAGATFHLRTLRSEDFPALPRPGEEAVTLPLNSFVSTVSTVVRSASRDETRPVLTGVLVSATGSELLMVATDSYRLSVKRTRLESPVGASFEANVPARALQELSRIAPGEAGELSVSLRDSQVVFDLSTAVLSSRLIDGQFPNYRQLLPESVEHELRFSTAELAGVVRRVSLLAQKNAPLRLRFTQGELTVSAETPDVGQACEALPVPFQGDPFEIGFNPEFLRDGLESVESDEVVVKLISPVRPGLIESPGSADFIYLIMPIRLT
jgi:DNA polymerase III subunit beta